MTEEDFNKLICDRFGLKSIDELRARGPVEPWDPSKPDGLEIMRERDRARGKRMRRILGIFLFGGVIGWFSALDYAARHNEKRFGIKDLIEQTASTNEEWFKKLDKLEHDYPTEQGLRLLHKEMQADGVDPDTDSDEKTSQDQELKKAAGELAAQVLKDQLAYELKAGK